MNYLIKGTNIVTQSSSANVKVIRLNPFTFQVTSDSIMSTISFTANGVAANTVITVNANSITFNVQDYAELIGFKSSGDMVNMYVNTPAGVVGFQDIFGNLAKI